MIDASLTSPFESYSATVVRFFAGIRWAPLRVAYVPMSCFDSSIHDHPSFVQILDSITDGFFMVDRNWRITFANKRATDILAREDLMHGATLWELFPEVFHSEFGVAYRLAMEVRAPQRVEGYYEPYQRWYEAAAYPSDFGLTIFFRDITERKLAMRELVASQDRARELARRLITIQEDERARVSRDIHDVLGQALTAIKIDAVRLANDTALSDEQRARATRISAVVDGTINDVRALATMLRPIALDDLGLYSALVAEARTFSERTGVSCTVAKAFRQFNPSGEMSTAIFRVIQEALTNVARHSSASRVSIALRRAKESVAVMIRDDGQCLGKEAREGRLGLIGMRERAMLLGGELTVKHSARGTVVRLEIFPNADSTVGV